MSFQKESLIIRNIGEPCIHQSPLKTAIDENKMLKPDKWQATFENDGKISGFQKVLKSITLGGVDPSIRQEVWEFLLGCYALNSTTIHRKQLRIARRERYSDLVKQCQTMESSIGTGSLADVVGFKVMDMRTRFKYERRRDVEVQNVRISKSNSKKKEDKSVLDGKCSKKSYFCRKGQSYDFGDYTNVRRSTTKKAYGSCRLRSPPHPYNYGSTTAHGPHEAKYERESYMDISASPAIHFWEKDNKDIEELRLPKDNSSKMRYKDARLHGVQTNNNSRHINESNSSQSRDVAQFAKSKVIYPNVQKSHSRTTNLECEGEVLNKFRVSDAPETPTIHTTISLGVASEEKVTDWLWTVHRIVVDVVRTDTHLEFYEDTRNLARMSDILAVYAWVDPTIGYCQGMSDLLSPFIILFEDNADAFWCFVMLLRRMRDNFKMEGLTGVMKQLQALSHILEITDKDMFSHLSYVGAESLHFAFRMLLVLFRRELSFSETLCMWEMIWAADFDASLTSLLDENCPELLVVQLPKQTEAVSEEERIINKSGYLKGGFPSRHGIVGPSVNNSTEIRSTSTKPHFGLAKSFWSRNNHLPIPTIASLIRNGDDELPVFCVAAILIMNRQKIIRETYSVDDLIKICNDNMLEIRVKRCVHAAIKLRKKYFYKLIKSRIPATQNARTHNKVFMPSKRSCFHFFL